MQSLTSRRLGLLGLLIHSGLVLRGIHSANRNCLCISFRRTVGLAILLSSFLIVAPGGAFSGENAENIIIPVGEIENGGSGLKTLDELRKARTSLRTRLVEIFNANSKDHDYLGRAHVALLEIGNWRFNECVTLLLDNIDWSIKASSVRGFQDLTGSAYFPCAVALVEIGGYHVKNAVLLQIRNTDDERRLRLLSWVLSRVCGAEILDEVSGMSKLKSTTEIVKARLIKASGYIGKGDENISVLMNERE